MRNSRVVCHDQMTLQNTFDKFVQIGPAHLVYDALGIETVKRRSRYRPVLHRAEQDYFLFKRFRESQDQFMKKLGRPSLGRAKHRAGRNSNSRSLGFGGIFSNLQNSRAIKSWFD